jgi:transposase-like protein
MKIFEFNKYFPDEAACRKAFKEMRDREGVTCQHCGSHDVVWLESKQQYQCKHCRHRTTLRSGTVMHGSKLPFMYWFIAMHLLTATKKSISASELQRQLGHKRYQPIWEMMHKLRSVMGKRDDKYTLKGFIELDEGFFSTETPAEQKEEKLKAGVGSQRKSKVLVVAESTPEENPKKGQKAKSVGHIKMIVIPNAKAITIDAAASKTIDKDSMITTDASTSHIHFKDIFTEHKSQVIDPNDIGKVLPWVHIAIANAKTLLADMYHGVKPEFLQEYLNEFCYKFNRRYFGEDLFERLLLIAASYRTDFEHKTYRKAA